jgi:two-component system nitrate/nitrite response regulator NarL
MASSSEPAVVPEPVRSRPAPSRVVLADDHPLFRDGLARAISTRNDLELVGQAGEGITALALIEELRPDVALLDVKMPGLDGLEICRLVTDRRLAVRTRVVLLSAYLDASLVSRAVCAGAAGYLGKDATRVEICDALVEVATGGTAFGRKSTGGLVEELERLFFEESSPSEPAPEQGDRRLSPPDTTSL